MKMFTVMLALGLSVFAFGEGSLPLSGSKADHLSNALSRIGAFHQGSIKAGYGKQDVSNVQCTSVIPTKVTICKFTDNVALDWQKKKSMSSQEGPDFANAVNAFVDAAKAAGIRSKVLVDVVKLTVTNIKCSWKFSGLKAGPAECQVTP